MHSWPRNNCENKNKVKCIWRFSLIIYQVKGAWQIKYKELKPYHEYLSKLIEGFEEIEFTHLGRDKNQFFDALATLASMTQIDYEDPVKFICIRIKKFPCLLLLNRGRNR
jgi:hypothetical protein